MEIETAIWVQTIDDDVCILLYANTLENSMNSSCFSPAIGIEGKTGFFSFGKATGLEEIKLWIQTSIILLKNWTWSYPAHEGEVV